MARLRWQKRVGPMVWALLLLVGLIPVQLHAMGGPTAAEYGVVLNLSGKQRMLTQKMSKEVMLIALDVDKAANLTNLKGTAALFDKTLKGLRDGDADLKLPPTNTKRIRRQLGKVEKIWGSFQPVIDAILASGSVSKEQIDLISAQNLPLLKQMNKGVKLYEKDASKAGMKADPGLAVTINLSGKQRMLTQKMSKEFLLAAYGHDTENNKLNLLETYSLFERTLKGLLDGDSTLDLPGTKSETIRTQLGVVNGLWTSFKPIVAFGADPATSSIPMDKIQTLAKTNLPLLKQMNKAVKMYEKEAAK
ncbi:type IV pili methyl-accepting chemotaxis transducer N-terminal domain-containing protein [Magnetococcus sp. PR-3]|uniref:type IV pili methyl-accepting chemotaxis transducer N-terminal domain-containing protein n=1 Tax=Magnetococcus sp. PR-3 TaxID=3120355 RepID=UPI002FCE27DA